LFELLDFELICNKKNILNKKLILVKFKNNIKFHVNFIINKRIFY